MVLAANFEGQHDNDLVALPFIRLEGDEQRIELDVDKFVLLHLGFRLRNLDKSSIIWLGNDEFVGPGTASAQKQNQREQYEFLFALFLSPLQLLFYDFLKTL